MASAETRRKRGRGRWPWIVGILVVLALAGGGVIVANQRAAQPVAGLPEGWTVTAAEAGPIESTVSATGNVEAAAEADLQFSLTGTIVEVLVSAGDSVTAGQALARLDSGDYELQLADAETSLRQAQAEYESLLAGASEAEIAEAQARVEQARRQYQQTASSVSRADVAAARAELERARVRLAELQAGPETAEAARAQENIQRAQANLDQARTSLSAAKERARLDMETRANALRNAQDEYSRIYWENRQLADQLGQFGRELPQENRNREEAALRAVTDAEAALEAARIAYEQARQDEITTLQTREAELTTAQAELDKLMAGPKADEIASARADVQRAQASLDQLVGAERSSSLAAQESGIAIAQAGLDRLIADPDSGTLAVREAAVARAEISLKQAQRRLEQATLTAPFPATVARVDMQAGEASTGATLTLADLSSYHIDLPVDELDVAQIEPGQTVRVALDALPDAELTGTVTAIAPLATRNEQGTTTYEVRVTLAADSPGVRPGMTAVVEIVTSRKEDAVLVPRRAVRLEGGRAYVLINVPGQAPPAPVAPGQEQPLPGERREVVIGLSNSEVVEIVEGLAAGEEVLVQDVVSTFNPSGPPR